MISSTSNGQRCSHNTRLELKSIMPGAALHVSPACYKTRPWPSIFFPLPQSDVNDCFINGVETSNILLSSLFSKTTHQDFMCLLESSASLAFSLLLFTPLKYHSPFRKVRLHVSCPCPSVLLGNEIATRAWLLQSFRVYGCELASHKIMHQIGQVLVSLSYSWPRRH